MTKNPNIIYCGFGGYIDTTTGKRFEKKGHNEKTAADGEDLIEVNDGVIGFLERDFVSTELAKMGYPKL